MEAAVQREEHARELYYLILQTANRILRNCESFELSVLQDHNPTYSEVAEIMESVRKIIFALMDDFDPHLCQQALDYCILVKDIGDAIVESDEEKLSQNVETLKRKPFV